MIDHARVDARSRGFGRSLERRTLVISAAMALVAAAGLIIALQGWRARGPDADVLGSLVRAAALVEHGEIPVRGTPTDLNSFRPPGTSWLMVPGTLLFDDPRVVELSATTLLYVATLPAVWLLGCLYFNPPIAWLAVCLYAFSMIAVNFAGSLQPKAYAFFVAWMTYCAALWVARRHGRWLAGALLFWSAGMFVHIEMSPFVVMLPLIWWRYRPPVSATPVIVAALLSIVIWMPYLSFQARRGFVDLESQLLSRGLAVRGVETIAGCGEQPVPDPPFLPLPAPSPVLLANRAAAIPDMMLMNVQSRVLAGDFMLFGLLVVAVVSATARDRGRALPPPRVMALLAIVLAASIVISEFALRWVVASGDDHWLVNLRRLQVWAMVGAGIWLCGHPRIAAAARVLRGTWRRGAEVGVLVLAVAAPSAILMLFTEAGVNRRVGLVPLEMLLVAVGVAVVLEAARAPQTRRWILVALVVAVAIVNPVVLARVRDWRVHGWSGLEPAQVVAANFRLVRCSD